MRQGVAAVVLIGLFGLLLGVTGSAQLERADFVMNNGAEIATLDPAVVSGVPEGRVMYALYEGLTVKHPETLAPLPGMAESWELSADGLTYTFHIRADARWSNGDPLTAHDFEWSWRRLLTPELAAEYAYQLWYVRGARQYTLLPDDRWYGDMLNGFWVKELGDGRARVGLHGFLLERGHSPDDSIRLGLGPGDLFELDAHDPFVFIQTEGREGHQHIHLTGTVVAVNPELPATVGELLEDPYERHWILEVELAEGAIEQAREADRLFSAEVARDDIFWPHVGVRARDDRTLVVELASPTPFFIDLVSFYPTFPVHRPTIEWARENFPDTWQIEWVRPENIVTNGPYVIRERRINDRIRLVKSPVYWDADAVAMQTIDILAVEHYGTMLNLYLSGEVDWIDRCATNLVPRLLPREDFNPRAYLGTYFYRVNTTRPPLDDARVRRALALSIDRRAICEKIMKKGEEASWSLCPGGLPGYERPELLHAPVAPSMSDYDRAFSQDCAEAAELLRAAGYGPGGKAFPTIEIHYNTSEAHRDVAEVIADGWKRLLGINAKLLNQEWKVYLDTQNTLDYDVSRSAWIGDYADPNTFVDLFITGGENNRTGWGDPRYDQLVQAAAREADAARRLELLAEAEAILLEALPILPIYSYVTQNLVNPRLGGFFENVQDDHFPRFFYWMDDEELAARRAAQPPEWELVPAPGPARGLYAQR